VEARLDLLCLLPFIVILLLALPLLLDPGADVHYAFLDVRNMSGFPSCIKLM
jgi:hypothetical protein